MKIAVTGASGHIGSNLCRKLIGLGHTVRVLSYKDKRGFEGLPVEQVQGSMEDIPALETLTRNSDIVFHLAAQISIEGKNDRMLVEKNVVGTRNVVEVVRGSGCRRLIHFSSIHSLEHEPLDQILDENRPLALNDPIYYTRSKALSEKIVLDAVGDGLDAVIINPTAVVGPLDYKPSLLGQAIIRFYKGKIPSLIPGGYDWVDVRDVVEGAVTAIERGRKGHRYILSGHWESIRNLGIMVHRAGGARIPAVYSPYWLAYAGIPVFRLLAKFSDRTPLYTRESLHIVKTGNPRISHNLATEHLDYHPRSLEESITDALAWYTESGYL